MPPRLRCLNASRLSAKLDIFPSYRATLSTAARLLAAGSTPSSATHSLLSSTSDHEPRPQPITLPTTTRSDSSPRRGVSPPRTNTPGNSSANSRVQKLVGHATAARAAGVHSNTIEELRTQKLAIDLTRQIHRRWKAGDVYAPHDLSAAEMQKFKRRARPEVDAFDVLGVNPLEEYKNFSIMSEYMTPMGRILGSSETGLRGVNQRRLAKAIRRSIGLGLMPSVYRHPEILRKSDVRMKANMNQMRP